MLVETLVILLGLFFSIGWAAHQEHHMFLWFAIIAQGFWLQRIYCVGHEASHQKLFPNHPFANDGIGQLFLWIILVPIPIFRKIHLGL